MYKKYPDETKEPNEFYDENKVHYNKYWQIALKTQSVTFICINSKKKIFSIKLI